MSDDITSHVAEHDNLLRAIEAVEHAPPILKQMQTDLKQSQQRHEEDNEKLKALEVATKKQYAKWMDITDRKPMRIWAKLPFTRLRQETLTERQQREEEKYLDAFAAEQRQRTEKETLGLDIRLTEDKIENLKQISREHTRLRNQLECLYESIFGGPTPKHPEEDQAEQAYEAAVREFNEIQDELHDESRVLAFLQEADQTMNLADRYLAQGDNNSLAAAQRQVDSARVLVEQARELRPAIPSLQVLNIPQGAMSDVLFDNIVTAVAFDQKIQTAVTKSKQAHEQLRKASGQSQMHLNVLKARRRQAEIKFTQETKILEELRREIMQCAAETLPTYQPRASGPPPSIDTGYEENRVVDASTTRPE